MDKKIMYGCLILDLDKLQDSSYSQFVSQLQEMSAHCNSMSLGEVYTGGRKTAIQMLERPLFLVLPLKILEKYNNDIFTPAEKLQNFNNGTIFNHSIGHCYITWDKKINVCGIWDVCLHKKYLAKTGYGSILFETIINALNLYLPNTDCKLTNALTGEHECTSTILWLGINLRNVNFSKVVHLYTKYGFKNPFVSFLDPFGRNWSPELPDGYLSLSRDNNFLLDSDIDIDQNINNVIYVIDQYNKKSSVILPKPILEMIGPKKMNQYGYCDINMKFDSEYAKLFNKLPLAASSMDPTTGIITQRETGGVLLLVNPIMNESDDRDEFKIVWHIIMKRDTLVFGKEDEVSHVQGKYSFHSHPHDTYNKLWYVPMDKTTRKVTVGVPSPIDYTNFLSNVLCGATGFTCVFAVEGIFVICLQTEWFPEIGKLRTVLYPNYPNDYNMDQNWKTQIENIMNKYWGYQWPGMTPEESGKHYAKLVSAEVVMNYKEHNKEYNNTFPLFKVQFYTWDEILDNDDTIIRIKYPMINGICLATTNDLENISKLHPSFSWKP